MRRIVGLVMLVAVSVAAAPAAAAVPQRTCRTRAEGSAPPRRFAGPNDVLVGPVAFVGLRNVADPAEFATFENRAETRFLVKAAIGVRAGRSVTVAIAPEDQSVAGLTYVRGPAGGVPAVRFSACGKNEPAFSYNGPVGLKTGFAGGFSLTEARCVHIAVTDRARKKVYRRVVAFGTEGCGTA
jgi:hypothetical protein